MDVVFGAPGFSDAIYGILRLVAELERKLRGAKQTFTGS
jgi:hypothetical protein